MVPSGEQETSTPASKPREHTFWFVTSPVCGTACRKMLFARTQAAAYHGMCPRCGTPLCHTQEGAVASPAPRCRWRVEAASAQNSLRHVTFDPYREVAPTRRVTARHVPRGRPLLGVLASRRVVCVVCGERPRVGHPRGVLCWGTKAEWRRVCVYGGGNSRYPTPLTRNTPKRRQLTTHHAANRRGRSNLASQPGNDERHRHTPGREHTA